MNMPQIALHGLPKRLVDDQLIAANVIEEASASAKTNKISLVQYLCDKHLLSSHQIGESASKEFGIPLYALDQHNSEYFPRDIVDSKLLKKHQAIPLVLRGKRLFLAIADPTNQRAITENSISGRCCSGAGAGTLFGYQRDIGKVVGEGE